MHLLAPETANYAQNFHFGLPGLLQSIPGGPRPVGREPHLPASRRGGLGRPRATNRCFRHRRQGVPRTAEGRIAAYRALSSALIGRVQVPLALGHHRDGAYARWHRKGRAGVLSVVLVQTEECLDRTRQVVRPGSSRKGRLDRPEGWLCSHDKGLFSRRSHGFTLWELYPFYHGTIECGNRIVVGWWQDVRRLHSRPFMLDENSPPSGALARGDFCRVHLFYALRSPPNTANVGPFLILVVRGSRSRSGDPFSPCSHFF